MTTAGEYKVTTLLDRAAQTCGDAIKAGVRIQEDVARWWGDMLEHGGTMETWQKRSRAMLNEAIPTAQKNTEEWLRLIEENNRRAMDLLKKAFEPEQAGAETDVRARAQEVLEASLEAMRDAAQKVAQTNAQMLGKWAEILSKSAPGGEKAPAGEA